MSAATAGEVLRRALRLLGEHGEHWTQRVMARGADGLDCSVFADGAAQWCALGAVLRAAGDEPQDVFNAAHLLLVEARPQRERGWSIGQTNDAASWPEVRDWLGAAIALAERG